MKFSTQMSFAGAAAIAALLITTPVAHAQSVTGTWNVVYDSKMAMSGGGDPVVEERSNAKLTLVQKGDSVTGSWLTTSPQPAGMPAPTPRPVRGTVSGNTIRLISGPAEATLNRNGEMTKVQMITDYEANITGDSITGTMKSHAVGNDMALARKFEATRAKS